MEGGAAPVGEGRADRGLRARAARFQRYIGGRESPEIRMIHFEQI